MPRKTLALISGLVLVTVILFIVAVRTNNQTAQPQPSPAPETQVQQPSTPAHSVLSLSPNPVTVGVGQKGTVAVNIDTSDNAVTAVQLEIAYDPTVIGNVQVTPGSLFPNPVILINKNNATAGRFTYAYGISPSSQTVQGTGEAAVITFTAKNAAGKQAQLALLPETLITARGVANSVLKQTPQGTIINITAAGAGSAAGQPAVQQQTQPAVQQPAQ